MCRVGCTVRALGPGGVAVAHSIALTPPVCWQAATHGWSQMTTSRTAGSGRLAWSGRQRAVTVRVLEVARLLVQPVQSLRTGISCCASPILTC